MAANDFNERVIEEFRANEGRVGGPFEGAPVLLLHTTGAKSGQERLHPMMYLREGERLYVFASRGGAPNNPAWYHNLVANPDVVVEVGTETFPARATPLQGEERQRVFDEQKSRYSAFADYERKTDREIPVIALDRATG